MSEILYANLPQLVQQQQQQSNVERGCMLLEDACVLLDNDDIQCGQIFFSESTRVLKYFCVFCKSTYDNINYYCDHLSTHINEDENETMQESQEPQEPYTAEEAEESIETIVDNSYYYSEAAVKPETLESIENMENIEAMVPLKFEEKNVNDVVESMSNEVVQHTIHEDVTTHIVPTTSSEDAFWNKPSLNVANEKSIFCQQEIPIYEDPNTFDIAQNVETTEVFEQSYTATTEDISHNTDGSTEESEAAMDFENMIAATNIRGNLNEVCKREKKKKSKKVTTVKVIAVRNRIAELYDKIKSEEEKRSQLNNFEAIKSEDVNTINQEEFISNDDSIIDQSEENGTANSVLQKVRGETVITLLPNSIQSEKTMLTNSYVDKSLQPLIDQSPKEGKSREKVCPACGLQFRSSFSLTIHKRTHYLESNSEVKLAHKCSDCNRLFNKISEMKVHLERDHYPDGFICKICQKRLTSLTLLEKHMRLVHLNRPFSCKVCQKSFETRTLFESHVDSHIEGRNYKCHICGRKYGTEQSLKHHMRRHKEQVPKCCVVCGKMTLRITQHMKIHTPRPKRVLSCSVCGKLFNFSSGLSHHFKIMHKQSRPVPKAKPEAITTVHSNSHITMNTRRKRRATLMRHGNDMKVEQEVLLDAEQRDLHLLQHQQEHQHEAHEQILIDNEVQHELQQDVHYTYTSTSHQLQQQDVNEKEEEAKRVIVELIQNATYTSFLPDNHMNEFEVGPPIAREETISAVNSIVNDC